MLRVKKICIKEVLAPSGAKTKIVTNVLKFAKLWNKKIAKLLIKIF
jgi:hypothetical protein